MPKYVPPSEATKFCDAVIDVREFPEYAAGAIPGSYLVPLARVEGEAGNWNKKQSLLLVCRTGKRARQAAEALERLGFGDVNVLEGGMTAWNSAGLPMTAREKRPWSMERQVRTIAGALVLLFTVMALSLSAWLLAGTIFVGAGLVFAGVTDVCLMATFLGKLPWNRPSCYAGKKVNYEHDS